MMNDKEFRDQIVIALVSHTYNRGPKTIFSIAQQYVDERNKIEKEANQAKRLQEQASGS